MKEVREEEPRAEVFVHLNKFNGSCDCIPSRSVNMWPFSLCRNQGDTSRYSSLESIITLFSGTKGAARLVSQLIFIKYNNSIPLRCRKYETK